MCARFLWINILAVKCVTLDGQDIILDQDTVYAEHFAISDEDDIVDTEVVVCLVDCGVPDYIEENVPEVPKIPKATSGKVFPWYDVRYFNVIQHPVCNALISASGNKNRGIVK